MRLKPIHALLAASLFGVVFQSLVIIGLNRRIAFLSDVNTNISERYDKMTAKLSEANEHLKRALEQPIWNSVGPGVTCYQAKPTKPKTKP